MKLIIFDCDGTLVDSEFLCNLALSQQLTECGIPSNITALITQFRGWKLASIIGNIEAEYGVTLPTDFEQEYRLKIKRLFSSKLKANPGVHQLLSSLDIPFCVASSAPRAKIEHALEVTGLSAFFKQNIFSGYDIQAWKPDPTLFLHVAKSKGLHPKDCLVIEDSLVGLLAAKRAKMRSIYYAPHKKSAGLAGITQVSHMSEIGELLTEKAF